MLWLIIFEKSILYALPQYTPVLPRARAAVGREGLSAGQPLRCTSHSVRCTYAGSGGWGLVWGFMFEKYFQIFTGLFALIISPARSLLVGM